MMASDKSECGAQMTMLFLDPSKVKFAGCNVSIGHFRMVAQAGKSNGIITNNKYRTMRINVL